jgi:hypothetical protein
MAWSASVAVVGDDRDGVTSYVEGDHVAFGPFDSTQDVADWLVQRLLRLHALPEAQPWDAEPPYSPM